MRLLLTKEWEGQPAGLLTELPDEKGKAAIAAGAAVEAVKLRFKRDHVMRGMIFPANFDRVLPHDDDAKKAVADGHAEYADPTEAERFKTAAAATADVPQPAEPERRTRAPKGGE